MSGGAGATPGAGRHPDQRPAYEPVGRILGPTPYDPGMPRPAATVAGALLVFLGAVVGILSIIDLSVHWTTYAGSLDLDINDVVATPDVIDASLTAVLVLLGVVVLVELVCGILILRGSNLARVVVMSVTVISISTAFASWWAQDQEITLTTTLPSLAVDILVLLALSSRSAAGYARRNEKR